MKVHEMCAACRIRIRSDPELFAGSGSEIQIFYPVPDKERIWNMSDLKILFRIRIQLGMEFQIRIPLNRYFQTQFRIQVKSKFFTKSKEKNFCNYF